MAGFKRRISDAAGGPTTFVTAATTIVGRISGEGPYVFCGEVDGECDIDGTVTLAAGGRWRGVLRATHAIVAGEVEGEVIATSRLEVSPTARVNGTLTGHSIAVAEGAIIEGDINVQSGEQPLRFEEKRTG